MTDERQEVVQVNEGTPRWLGVAVVALAAVSLLALGVGWSASNHAREAQTATENDAKVLRQNLDVVTQRLSQAEAVNSQVQGDLSVVTDRLKLTQGELDKSRKQAVQIRSQYSKQLTEMQDKVQTELQGKASTEDVQAISTDVNGVKGDLDTTKQGLLAANGMLTEHGTQIARNHDEIDQLRRLGQRDYYEFTIATKGTKEKVGSVSLELRGVNVKHNQYTVALYVDDMRLEKKNRAINEPIFFYTRGTRSSMELVVNSIGKDKIVGYLSVPKVQVSQGNASSSGSN